jgi:hypothetical protein
VTVQFECIVLAGLSELDSFTTIDEEAAVEWAQSRLSPLMTQVTIEACAGDVGTFGIRHLHADGSDTGWSCWFEGDKVTTRNLDVLFARAPRVFSERVS